jgi:hypothetical protein
MENLPKLIVESKIDKLSYYLGFVIYVAFIIYFLTVFNQNPILISILIAILLIFILILNYMQVKIYSNRIEIINNGPFRFNSKVRVYYYEQITSIDTVLRVDGTSGLFMQIVGIFRASVNLATANYFTLIFYSGKRESFSTQILSEDLIKGFKLIENLSGNKIKVTGLDNKIPLL